MSQEPKYLEKSSMFACWAHFHALRQGLSAPAWADPLLYEHSVRTTGTNEVSVDLILMGGTG